MTATIDVYEGYDLFASNDNVHPQAASRSEALDSRFLLSTDVGLFQCLLKLGTPRERVCSALQISNEEYDYIAAKF